MIKSVIGIFLVSLLLFGCTGGNKAVIQPPVANNSTAAPANSHPSAQAQPSGQPSIQPSAAPSTTHILSQTDAPEVCDTVNKKTVVTTLGKSEGPGIVNVQENDFFENSNIGPFWGAFIDPPCSIGIASKGTDPNTFYCNFKDTLCPEDDSTSPITYKGTTVLTEYGITKKSDSADGKGFDVTLVRTKCTAQTVVYDDLSACGHLRN